jgi:transcriptional regulator with XRE-family HTH domain
MLARKSGINLRTLQQYESGAKDINKASVTTLKALADTLGVGMEELMEPGNRN